jgi:hypothetical protein
MKTPNSKPMALAATLALVATAAYAATLFIQLDPPVVVSQTSGDNAFKGKMGRIAYMNDTADGKPRYDVQAQIIVYADGSADGRDIWVARSIDGGATWDEQNITNSGGTEIPALINPDTGLPFKVSANKPNLYVAPIGVLSGGKGADALLTWTGSDCGESPVQKINTNLNTGPQPYMCLWTARSTDGGQTWTPQRLTDGSLDVDEDVPSGYVTSTLGGGFAISFQADPQGLQQGEAEGPGDGASGAKVSPGTNIWYTYLSKTAFETGTDFPMPVQVSNNNDTETGSPGASRANLQISGGTTVLAYEETKGGGGGKQIIYHSFPYATPDTNNAGTVISNPDNNARRVRFLLQGNAALGDTDGDGDAADGDTAGVHAVVLWRETTLLDVPAAASDIMLRRGIKNTNERPCDPAPLAGLCGFRAADVLADPAVNMSDTGSDDNALAHRGVLRGEFIAVAYDHTPIKAATDASPPTGTYNLFVRRSTDGGVTWDAARNLSNLLDASTRVVEPRLVGTPGTIVLPGGAATDDPSDVQDRNVMFVAWGTETNVPDTDSGTPLDLYLTRTTNQGASYEKLQVLAGGPNEQSETQLRSPPDGKTLGALWMEHDATSGAIDVMYRNGVEAIAPDEPVPALGGDGGGCAVGGDGRFDPTLPGMLGAALAILGLRRRAGK